VKRDGAVDHHDSAGYAGVRCDSVQEARPTWASLHRRDGGGRRHHMTHP